MGMYCKLEEVTPAELNRVLKLRIEKPGPDEQADRLIDFLARGARQDPSYLKQLGDEIRNLNLGYLPKEVPPEMQAKAEAFKQQLQERIKKAPRRAAPRKNSTFKSISKFSLEKEWHVLHYVLNGTSEAEKTPLGACILGGKEMNAKLCDYGPPRYLEPNEVVKIAIALKKVDGSRLVSKLDVQDAKEKRIYLAHTISRPHDWDHLPELFSRFRAFYEGVASRKNAVVSYIE